MVEVDHHVERCRCAERVGEALGHGDHRLADLGPREGEDLLAGIDDLPGLGVAAGDDAVEVGM